MPPGSFFSRVSCLQKLCQIRTYAYLIYFVKLMRMKGRLLCVRIDYNLPLNKKECSTLQQNTAPCDGFDSVYSVCSLHSLLFTKRGSLRSPSPLRGSGDDTGRPLTRPQDDMGAESAVSGMTSTVIPGTQAQCHSRSGATGILDGARTGNRYCLLRTHF